MDREAIIHIGPPKTGTTAIQQALKLKRDLLGGQGAAFPLSPGGGSPIHAFLTFSAARRDYRPGHALWGGVDPEQRLAQFAIEFKAEMSELPPNIDRVIFSDEKLAVELREPQQVARLRGLLEPYFNRFTIVPYLRRQDALMASQYSQLLRVGIVMDPAGLPDYCRRMGHYNYKQLLNRWAAVFGESAIKSRIYEPVNGRRFDSIDDFLAICTLQLAFTPAERGRFFNPSFSSAAQAVLRDTAKLLVEKFGRASLGGPIWQSISIAATGASPGKGWQPTQAEAAAFLAGFAAGNEEVRRRFHPERATLFSDDFSHLPVQHVAPSNEEIYEAACKILIRVYELEAGRQRKAKRGVRHIPSPQQATTALV